MSAAQASLSYISTHVVDILGNVTGRDQPVMKMDKAVQLVECLDKEVFTNDKYVFFDPFCKAGEILLATALVAMKYKSQKKLTLMDTVFKEMYQSNRYFALAPDERHYSLSLRTFYGNKNSHNPTFTKNIKNGAYLSEVDGRLKKNKFNKELKAMLEYIKQKTGNKKIIAVGNPPYQENYKESHSNTGANPVYHFLLNSLIVNQLIDQFVMVIPSRWFSGGRGQSLRNFALQIRKSKQIRQIHDFEDSREIFPTVSIKGGVCFLHWSSGYDGNTLFYNRKNSEKFTMDLSKSDIIVRDRKSQSIMEKIRKKSQKYVSGTAWSWNPFGLSSNYFDKNPECMKGNLIECFTKRKIKRKVKQSKINKNIDKINTYKVVCPKAVKTGGVPYKEHQLFIISPKQVCTESYMVIDCFKSKHEAKQFLSYLSTDFVRFLVSIKKITQDITKDTWSLVPDLKKYENWTDKKLFNYFHLTQEEQRYIMKKVTQWES